MIVNCLDHRFKVFKNFMVPVAKHFDPSLGEKSCSPLVMGSAIDCVVLTSIKFYREFELFAVEVKNIWWHRMLAAELERQ